MAVSARSVAVSRAGPVLPTLPVIASSPNRLARKQCRTVREGATPSRYLGGTLHFGIAEPLSPAEKGIHPATARSQQSRIALDSVAKRQPGRLRVSAVVEA
jgi:hypothetical protein